MDFKTMLMRKTCTSLAGSIAILASMMSATPGQASVVMSGTRVIFPASEAEVTVGMTSRNEVPVLIQTWIDAGDPDSTPDKVDTPFLVTPPLYRINPDQQQVIRILATDNDLPVDRESVFYLNVLEIPPKPDSPEFKGKNVLQFAIRSRLKLFYRPSGLAGDANTAASKLAWQVVPADTGFALKVTNPTPYHVTIARLSLEAGGEPLKGTKAIMVPPNSEEIMPVEGFAQPLGGPGKITFEVIDDFGAARQFDGKI